MKKYVSILIIGLVICSGLIVIAQPTRQQSIQQQTVLFSTPQFSTTQTYTSVNIDQTNSFLMEQGKPLIPSYVETFYFPFGTAIQSVTVQTEQKSIKSLAKPLEPTPEMRASGRIIQEQNNNKYGTEPYPSQLYDYRLGCGLINGEQQIIVTVEIYPITYYPQQQSIAYSNEASIQIDYELSEPQPLSYSNDYELVVIAPTQFSSQINPLISHKQGRGITARFVSLTDIYDGVYFSVQGRDNQEKIKYFIKDTIENWNTQSVLLVGGSSYVPVRETHVFLESDPVYGDEIFVTDLYYADIYNQTGGFSCWDTNNNNLFGEYDWNGEYDEVDLYPNVYVNRIPATSSSQVSTVVNKIIQYENNQAYLEDWFSNFVLVGGDTFVGDNNEVPEGEYSNEKALEIMDGFIGNKIWATNEKLSGVVPTGVANIQNAINSGAGFVDMSGHGNTNIWATHPLGNSNIWIPTPFPPGGFRLTHISALSNGNRLPIVTVEACSTAKFNVDANCYNWAFLSKSNGGAVGIFGATAIGYGYLGTSVIQGLIGKIGLDTYRAYRLDKATTLGEMWAGSITRYIKPNMNAGDYKTVEEWIAFGDPTLAIGSDSQPPAKPQKPSGPATFKVGVEQTFSTQTTDPNNDQVYYLFDWGDGTNSGWLGPFNSGETIEAKNTWNTRGDYEIRVVARDNNGARSGWSDTMPISVPLTYTGLLQQIIQIFQQQGLRGLFLWFIELLRATLQ
ncbi:MAG: C25 family cysteine peptidase [Thermoplasmatota archaeon]